MKKIFFLLAIISISFSCEWNANNLSQATQKDTTPPTITITSPNNSNTFGPGTIIIQGNATDDLKVVKVETSINGGTYTEAYNKGFSLSSKKLEWIAYIDTVPLNTGTHTITARATDQWDNTATTTITINVDNTTPLSELSGTPPLINNLADISITVGGTDIVSYQYQLDGGTWSAETLIATLITASGLSTGEHILTVIGKNSSGIWQSAASTTKYSWYINDKLHFDASDGAINDNFGQSVAISSDGSVFISGAPNDDDRGDSSGSAYIYNWTGSAWNQTKITPSDGVTGDCFGQSVAISSDGNTAIIGAYASDIHGGSGSAYIYNWTGSAWNQTKKLTASDGATGDHFGQSVAVSSDGSKIVIGAYTDDDNGDKSGSAYIYNWTGSTWNQTKITPSDGAARDNFGWSVAVSSDGSTVIVGAQCDSNNGEIYGSAYIYNWTGSAWNQTKKLTASDGTPSDIFGRSVAVSSDGSKIVIGAYADDENGDDAGSAYVYNWTGSTWNQTKITPSDGVTGDCFGQSVAISSDGSTIIIGAYTDDDNGDKSGSAYVYNWTGSAWNQTKKLTTSNGAARDYFGQSVAVSSDGNSAVIGACGKNSYQGSIYLFYQ